MLKRSLDIIISAAFLIAATPISLFVALAIKIDSPGPVLFRQRRLGQHRVEFSMLKFRTMVVDAESTGTGLFSYELDPRVTRVGAFLRKTSLDEIPQLWNVLSGSMSLVGPRPPVTYELDDEPDLPVGYGRRFNVKPGITGRAQVMGRNDFNWSEKIREDLTYVERYAQRGILEDCEILLQTVWRVLSMQGTIEDERTRSRE